MDPLELRKTIYLGDRGVKGILIQGSGKTVKIQIDAISRIRSPDGKWNYYTDEDIENGFLVFGNVEACTIEPPGAIPDDYVVSLEITQPDESPGKYLAKLRTAGLLPSGKRGEIVIRVACGTFHLEDPEKPSVQVTT